MSTIPTKQIDGDVVVGRNVAIGGGANIQGNARVGHNLTVEGWLEAKNIKGANKGLFATVTDLRNAYPQPHDGWFAGVSASAQDISDLGLSAQQGKALFRMYVGSGGEWVREPINKLYEIVVDNAQVDNLRESLARTDAEVNTLKGRVDGHDTEISGIKTQQTTLGNSINTNTGSINTLKGRVDGHDTSISRNAADIKAVTNSIGLPGGIAPLNDSGLIPAQYIPGAMDDVKEFDGFIAESIEIRTELASISGDASILFYPKGGCFVAVHSNTTGGIIGIGSIKYYNNWPGADSYGAFTTNGRTPEADKVYVDKSTNKTYRWSGSKMVVIGTDLALGETPSTAYPGDKGKRNASDIKQLQFEGDLKTIVNVHVLSSTLAPMTFSDVCTLLSDTTELVKPGTVITYRDSDNNAWTAFQFIGDDPDNGIGDIDNWKPFGNGSAVGNCYNVTAARLANGDELPTNPPTYDNKQSAIEYAISKGAVGIGVKSHLLRVPKAGAHFSISDLAKTRRAMPTSTTGST